MSCLVCNYWKATHGALCATCAGDLPAARAGECGRPPAADGAPGPDERQTQASRAGRTQP